MHFIYNIYIISYRFIYITLMSHDSYIGAWRVPDAAAVAENKIYKITNGSDTNRV